MDKKHLGLLSSVLRSLLLGFLLLLPLGLSAEGRVYTPGLVPKVFAEDSLQLLSDPEGYIDAEERVLINEALTEIRRSTGVEFAVVVVPSIGDVDIESFSTELFRLWGLGSKTRNDGLLLTLVMDQRKLRFETGYGMEGILTDVLASRIQRQEMIPLMREGKYGEAVYQGVLAVGAVIKGEEYTSDRRTARSDGEDDGWSILLGFCGLIVLAMGYSAFSSLKEKSLRARISPSEARSVYFRLSASVSQYRVILLVLCPPLGLIFYFYSRRILKEVQELSSLCPHCHTPHLKILSPGATESYLTPQQKREMELGSRYYHAYSCSHCAHVEVEGQDLAPHWHVCERCGARTVSLERKEPIQRGRYSVRLHYRCHYCGNTTHEDHDDDSAQKAQVASILMGAFIGGLARRSGGSSWGDSGGGGWGGGGFGGGSSGGGGATGGW